MIGLSDTRKTASGRPLKRDLSQAEIIERQDARIKLLEGQVELLKKLETTERRLLNTSQNLEPSKIFQLIHETVEQNDFKQMIKYFCELLGVSRSGYYSYLKASDTRLEREQKDLKAKEIILKAFNRRGYKKGSRSIKMILEMNLILLLAEKRYKEL